MKQWLSLPRNGALQPGRLRRGAILLPALVMVAIGGFILTSWLVFVRDNGRLAERDRQRVVAFHAAEAGVTQVIDWFNNPDTFGPDQVLFTPFTLIDEITGEPYESYFDENEQTRFEQYVDDPNTPEVEGYTVPDAELGSFQQGGAASGAAAGGSANPARGSFFSHFGARLLGTGGVLGIGQGPMASRVESIVITKVAPGVQPGLMQRPICRVVAKGRTNKDVQRTVEMIIVDSLGADVRAPAAILSEIAANFDGNADVWWGEVWAKDSIVLHNNLTQFTRNPSQDPWYFARATNHIFMGDTSKYADGRVRQGYSSTPVPQSAHNYYQPFLNAVDSGLARYTNLYQNQQLTYPDYNYEAIKELTLRRGYPYYRTRTGSNLIWPTDSNGSHYTDQNGVLITDPAHPNGPKSYDQLFNSNPNDANYLDGYNSFVFIDTTNGQAPAANGSNLATVQVSGNSTHSRGTIFLAANLTKTGQGSPPSLPVSMVERPDGANVQIPVNPSGVFHNGFLCVWGQVNAGGNPTVYGSIYAGRGFAAGGTPTVVYNHRLKDNILKNQFSRVQSRLWKTY